MDQFDLYSTISEKHFGFAFIPFSLLADASGETPLDVQLQTFDEWQVTESKFCPEEPVLVEIRMINSGKESVDSSLCPGGLSSYRALMQIYGADGSTIWDTDELDRLEEANYILEHGHAPILLGGPNEFRLKRLPPRGAAYLVVRWPQTKIVGEFVPSGNYTVEVEYRWLNVSGKRVPIRAGPVEIIVSADGCE